ncbi:outer membrane beta-barrel protein [Stenotrophobium rhamnosiphilum]|uniref:Porin n=1 Tax=Stenotrophobium rhamnosiphilum TaxID=2029166 RepID=A0A2T5MFZ3_9GAMM|nr:outer membrane beta-barrel protein [Stenotrophobium rhamnosiphilum]PTU31469.1 hypothetical protein CJD38_09035 [Stenotrophobium rhamnosiphilum]
MRKNIISVMATLAFLPAVSFAAAPTLTEVLDASGVTLAGHASGSYSYSHVGISGGGGSASDNTFTFDQAQLMISKLPTEGFGAVVDVYAGQDVKGGTYNYASGTAGTITAPISALIYPTGAFNTFSGGSQEINLHQAYVQYASGGLTIIGGKFATLAGYEVAADGANTNATRSLLYGQQAFTLTGVRAGYKVSDMFTAYVGLSNSAAGGTTLDTDNKKVTELGIALAPVTGLTVNVTDYIGTDGTVKTNLLDLVTAYTVGDLSLALNADHNTFKDSGVVDVKNTGVALYANYQVTKAFRAGIRGEYLQSKDDIAVTKIKRKEVTLTGGYAAAKNFDLVADVRRAEVKADGSPTKGSLTTAVLKAVYKF